MSDTPLTDQQDFMRPENLFLLCRRLERDRARLAGALHDLLSAKDCENCPNQGWWAERDRSTGDAIQVQCEFCYTDAHSQFNLRAAASAALASLEEK